MRRASPDSLRPLLATLGAACGRAVAQGFQSSWTDTALPALAVLMKTDQGPAAPAVKEAAPSSDAFVEALTQGLDRWKLNPEQLVGLRERLEAADALTPHAKALIEAARVSAARDLKPEPEADGEVDLDELVTDLEKRLSGISVDLSAVTSLWDQMEAKPRAALLDQLRYYAELHAFFAAAGKSTSREQSQDRGPTQSATTATLTPKPTSRTRRRPGRSE